MRRRELPTEHHATAPLRLDLAGGWTDVPPFSAAEGGVVVNAAVDLRVEAHLKIGGDLIRLVAEDQGHAVECVDAGGLVLDGRLDRHKAALRMFPVAARLTLTTRSAAPPEAGLGAPGALDVALVACLAAARAERLEPRELAEYGWQAAAVEARLPGGRQDHYAAALGGVHRFSVHDPDVGVEPITLGAAFAAELERRLVVCYTGPAERADGVTARVMGAYERGDAAVTDSLRALRDVAGEMARALRAADLPRVGELLSENWRRQLALDPAMRTEAMAGLERAMARAGALGGKAAGSGAGGAMFFVAGDDVEAARRAAREAGATLLPVRWAAEGVRVW